MYVFVIYRTYKWWNKFPFHVEHIARAGSESSGKLLAKSSGIVIVNV